MVESYQDKINELCKEFLTEIKPKNENKNNQEEVVKFGLWLFYFNNSTNVFKTWHIVTDSEITEKTKNKIKKTVIPKGVGSISKIFENNVSINDYVIIKNTFQDLRGTVVKQDFEIGQYSALLLPIKKDNKLRIVLDLYTNKEDYFSNKEKKIKNVLKEYGDKFLFYLDVYEDETFLEMLTSDKENKDNTHFLANEIDKLNEIGLANIPYFELKEISSNVRLSGNIDKIKFETVIKSMLINCASFNCRNKNCPIFENGECEECKAKCDPIIDTLFKILNKNNENNKKTEPFDIKLDNNNGNIVIQYYFSNDQYENNNIVIKEYFNNISEEVKKSWDNFYKKYKDKDIVKEKIFKKKYFLYEFIEKINPNKVKANAIFLFEKKKVEKIELEKDRNDCYVVNNGENGEIESKIIQYIFISKAILKELSNKIINNDNNLLRKLKEYLSINDENIKSITSGSLELKLYIPSDTELPKEVENHIKHILLYESVSYEKKLSIVASIKSGISAIMSRNGSHNIGSHVLAALTHEISEVTDNQKLFQYIQQRMDFIAQITTEIPDWTYPAYVVQDIMRGFYVQRHLLNKISESEGLSAYEFQPINNIKANNEQKDKLLIKVRYNDKDIISNENNKQELDINTQVQVAIPGGTVGYHAFYTILENFIRNCAKHEWVNKNNNEDNLIITIDIQDNDKLSYVKFKLYSNLLSENIRTLVKKQNNKLKESFIDFATGQLKPENWGLAEMKIAVGYLNQTPLSKIGDDGESICFEEDKRNNTYSGLIKAISCNSDRNKKNGHLAYQFAIPKPKILAIIGFKEDDFKVDKNNLKSRGIYFFDTPPAKKDFDFFLINGKCDKIDDEIKNMSSFPIRTICFSDNINSKNGFRFVKRISQIKNIKEASDSDELINIIYETWIKLNYDCNEQEKWMLKINPFDANTGSMERDIKTFIEEKAINEQNETNQKFNESEFKKSLDKIFSFVKSNFYKYEEDIETLPKIYRASRIKSDSKKENDYANNSKNIKSNEFKIFKVNSQEIKGYSKIIYQRHLSNFSDFTDNQYAESLSGAQFYFPLYSTLLERNNKRLKYRFYLSLLENGLFSDILILDERFYKFVKNYDKEKQFEVLRIYTSNNVILKNNYMKFLDGSDKKLILEKEGKYYKAVIIHQTILDQNFNSEKSKIEDFIAELKEQIPIVIVTSGRGKPDKLPKNAYFLPFSSIEMLLLKNYPEKLLLTKLIHRLFR